MGSGSGLGLGLRLGLGSPAMTEDTTTVLTRVRARVRPRARACLIDKDEPQATAMLKGILEPGNVRGAAESLAEVPLPQPR